jgi:subfamily B ATP-binding cassette protein MsbA
MIAKPETSRPRPTGIELGAILRPHSRALSLALLAVVGISLADLLQPWPLKIVLDNVVAGRRLPPWLDAFLQAVIGDDKQAILLFAVFAVLVVTVLDSVCSYAQSYLMTSVGEWVGHDLRRKVYHHIDRLSLQFYDQKQVGDLINRLTRDVDAVQSLVTTALMDTIVDVLTLAGMLVVMFYLNWRFSLVALIIAPILFGVAVTFKRRVKQMTSKARKKESAVVSTLQEVLSSIRVVKAFTREEFEEQRFEQGSREQVEATLEARVLKARLPPLIDIIVAAGTCVVLWYGAHLVMSAAMTAGALVLFMFYLRRLYSPLKDLAKMTNTFARASVGLEAIQELMREPEQRSDQAGVVASAIKGRIEFDHVGFSYGSGRLAVNDVSLTIEPGQIVAFVGPTGAGKTTFINLIPRFYDAQWGEIRLDGHDVRRFTLDSLRQQISFIPQETILFHAPIWQNIAYGRLDASREEIMRAARLAYADEFIAKLPEQYETMVGERGVTLSGGQRQRIAIARAIVRDAPILIMDEPTTGLDAASERLVLEALKNLTTGRTCIISAHRLSTVRRADMIFVVQDGQIVQRGTHQELLAQDGLYAMLYAIQFRKETDEQLQDSVRSLREIPQLT